MKKTLGFLFAFAVLGTSAISEQRYKIPAENFDGAKFKQRYNLKADDFHAEYVNGEMEIVIHDGVTLSDSDPVFEAPDTTKRDRLAVLILDLGSRDLTLAEVNELLRIRSGL